jgi:hypothetical protein
VATKKLKSIKGRALRITRLDECGLPVYGATSVIVSRGFVSVTFSEDTEEGETYRTKNAWGEYCVNDKDPDIMNFVAVSIQFCDIDPDAMDIIGGALPVVVGSDTIGWSRGPAAPVGAFALEVWTKAAGPDACQGGSTQWGYWIAPYIKNGKLDGDITIEQAVMTLSMTAEGYGAPAAWGVGPHGDNPWLATAGFPTGQFYGAVVTTVGPPAETATVQPLYGPKSAVQPGDIYFAEPTVTAQDATNAAKLTPLGYISAIPGTWASGEFMTVGVHKFHWSGTVWVAGPKA